jgi:hypothetical protein
MNGTIDRPGIALNEGEGAGADEMNNLYAYVGNNPTNYVDPLGLQKKPTCKIIIVAGHHLPRNPVDEVDRILKKIAKVEFPANTFIGGVGCFPKKIQETVVELFGKGAAIPHMPTGPVEGGGWLLERNAPSMLAAAWGAARDLANQLCKDGKCDEVQIVMECTPAMLAAIKAFGNKAQQSLCDNTKRDQPFKNVFKC